MNSSTRLFSIRRLLMPVLFLLPTILLADPVVFKVVNSSGGDLSDVTIRRTNGGAVILGTTNAAGELTVDLAPGNYTFSATYNLTGQSQAVSVPAGGTAVNFQTSQLNILVKQFGGDPISGAQLRYVATGTNFTIGNSDGSGQIATEMFPGSYNVTAQVKGTSSTIQTTVTAGINNLTFTTSPVSVTVRNSSSEALSGVPVWFVGLGTNQNFGPTDANGVATAEIFPGTYPFRASYQGTGGSTDLTVPVEGTSLTMYTSKANVTVKNTCSNTPIEGVIVRYQASGTTFTLGTTGATGNLSAELFSGPSSAFDFTALLNGTSGIQSVPFNGSVLSAGNVVNIDFAPTLVSFSQAGSKTVFTGGSNRSVANPIYLFAGTYNFTFNGQYTFPLEISGCTYDKSVAILVGKSGTNGPLVGAGGRGGYGSNFGTFFITNGPTNANGIAYDIRNTSATKTMSYELGINNSTAVVTQDISVNNVFSFQARQVTLKLAKCSGAGIAGGSARYGAGANFGSAFWPGGATDANGETKADLFPGTFSFEMAYQSTTEVKQSITVPDANTTFTWNTTSVTLKWPYDIAYGGATGDSRFFNKPSMELLPGTFKFNFRSPTGDSRADLVVSGCSMNKTVAVVRLKSSTNAPLADGAVQYLNGSTWVNVGATDAGGYLVTYHDGTPTTRSFKLTYKAGAQQITNHPIGTNPFVEYQTKLVTIDFRDGAGGPAPGTNLQYLLGSTPYTFGSGVTTNGVETMELLPVTYHFKLTYDAASVQISNQNTSLDPVVKFKLSPVRVKLVDSDGSPISNGVVDYASVGTPFKSIGTTDGDGYATKDLLSGASYFIRMIHPTNPHVRVQKTAQVPANILFVYNGSSISAEIISSFEPSSLRKSSLGANMRGSSPTEAAFASSVIVYPNPVVNELKIVTPASGSSSEISIVSVDGKLVKRQNVGSGTSNIVNMSAFVKGVYFVRIVTGDKVEIHKILKQ